MLFGSLRAGRSKKGQVLVAVIDSAGTLPTELEAPLRRRLKGGGGLCVGADLQLHPGEGSGFDHLLGLTVISDREVHSSEWWRRAGARLFLALESMQVKDASLLLPKGGGNVEALAEGFLLASYRYTEYLDPKGRARVVVRVSPSGRAVTAGLRRAADTAAAVSLARTLTNRPPMDLYPETFAAEILQMAKGHGARCKVFRGAALARDFPAIHTVGMASEHPPCLVRCDYVPKGKALEHWVLVGKGVTYDSGGYDIKPVASMFLMKKDMGGAASLVGAFDLIARRKLRVKVTLLVAAAENMISGASFCPGDIIKTRAGKSVEIYSTDAEGRIVLSDALTYASEMKPTGIVDMATLTGLPKRFFGMLASPVMGVDRPLMDELAAAGDRTHERLMPLELLREHREATRGLISDLRNWGKVEGVSAGTLVAGGFLAHFVKGTRWAHVDMSNTSWMDSQIDYRAAGATGFGARLVADWLEQRTAAVRR